MRYLIIVSNSFAFYTDWYDYENDYISGMVVVDRVKHVISFDGQAWKEIQEDHL